MSKESDYLRAEVSRAQKEGATSVLVRVPEIHAILARIAELERFKAELPMAHQLRLDTSTLMRSSRCMLVVISLCALRAESEQPSCIRCITTRQTVVFRTRLANLN